jgi:hypothetical protein
MKHEQVSAYIQISKFLWYKQPDKYDNNHNRLWKIITLLHQLYDILNVRIHPNI